MVSTRIVMQNNETKIIIAGFGGQGVVLAGTILARACLYEDKNTTQMVSYGAEMRGGTANSTVIISDNQIASPVVENPDIAIILNQPSLDKFESKIAPNGTIILNSSLVTESVKRDDITVVDVPAFDIARRLGNIRVTNIVAIGAFVKATRLLKIDSLKVAIKESFANKKADLVDINIKALEKGIENCNI